MAKKSTSKARVTVRVYPAKVDRVNSRGDGVELVVSGDEAKALVESGRGELVKTSGRGKETATE